MTETPHEFSYLVYDAALSVVGQVDGPGCRIDPQVLDSADFPSETLEGVNAGGALKAVGPQHGFDAHAPPSISRISARSAISSLKGEPRPS